MRASRFPSTLTLLPTYNCTASCANCCFGSHPGISMRLQLDRMLKYIDQASAMKTIRLVVFSGGECFTLGDELVIAVARCTENRLASRCVTNAYWATTEQRAAEVLDRLSRAGLRELNISTGDYHQEFVPVARAIIAAATAVSLGIRTIVVIESRNGRQFTGEHMAGNQRLAGMIGNPLFRLIESPWMPMQEGADVSQDVSQLASRSNLYLKGRCDSVLNTIVVTPDEHLGLCCGLAREHIPEMTAGSLRDSSIETLYFEAAHDFVKIWLAVEGPERILAWAACKNPSIQWEHRYAHHCHACRAIYEDPRVVEVILQHYREKEDDIMLRYAMMDLRATTSVGATPSQAMFR